MKEVEIDDSERLNNNGGLELTRVGFDRPFDPRFTSRLRYHTFLRNLPVHPGQFITFAGRDIDVSEDQKTGKIGDLCMEVSPGKEIYITRLFPFSAYVEDRYPWLLRKGVAAEMELLLAEDLLELLGEEYSIIYSHPSPSAIKHIANFGLEPNTPYKIKEYIVKIRNGLEQNRKRS